MSRPAQENAASSRPATIVPEKRRRGRGALTNRTGRFEALARQDVDDGWEGLAELDIFRTDVREETARKIITENQSPDINFDQSINPYRGCEHGCVYCYARPTHCFLGHSAGIDFETKLVAKTNAAEALRRELAAPGYQPRTIALGTNTDPYQPIERSRRLTRQILEVMAATRHPVGIVTKSASVVRDLDILTRLAADGLVKVAISVTTLEPKLARAMEPRASAPHRRLEALEMLSAARVPTAVMVAPIVPALNDAEIETILGRATAAGVEEAGYVLLRLPLEVRDLFREWLESHYPDRAARVFSLLRSTRGGKDYEAQWGQRMRGSGPYAWQIGRRFEMATKRHGLNAKSFALRTDLFEPPVLKGQQMRLL